MRISTQCLVIFNCYIYCLNIYIFCFILLFTSSSLCRKDQFAVSYFSTSLIVLIQVYKPWRSGNGLLLRTCWHFIYFAVVSALYWVSFQITMCLRFKAYCCISLQTLVLPPLFWGGGRMPPLPQTVRIRRRWGRSVARARMTWRKWKRKWWYQVSLRNSLVEQLTNGITDILSPDTYNLFAIIDPSL